VKKLLSVISVFVIIFLLFNVNVYAGTIDSKTELARLVLGNEGLGIIDGINDVEYITRAEMAEIMCKLTNRKFDARWDPYRYSPIAFLDVNKEHWAYEYINDLLTLQIVQGYGDETFRPDIFCTYYEFVKTLLCVLDASFYNQSMENSKSLYDYANEHLNLDVEPEKANAYITEEDAVGLLFDSILTNVIKGPFYLYHNEHFFNHYSFLYNYGMSWEIGYIRNVAKSQYKLNSILLNGSVYNEVDFKEGAVICFYSESFSDEEKDIVMCVHITDNLYRYLSEVYKVYNSKIESTKNILKDNDYFGYEYLRSYLTQGDGSTVLTAQ